jgi:inner membrane protein
MDNLTHSLTGVLLSRAGLNRLTPHAGWLAVGAANLPDIDIASGFKGALYYLSVHRGYTHAFAIAPLLALIPLPFWWLAARRSQLTRKQWVGAYVVSLVAILSHILLDWLNVYGIRFFIPFSWSWPRLDLVNIIDLWIWALLLLCVLGPMLARLVYSEIGARGGSGRGAAITGLVLVCVYIFGRSILQGRALEAANSRMYAGRAPQRVVALPSAAIPWRWTMLVETPTAWRVIPLDLTSDFDPDGGNMYIKPDVSAILQPVARTETAQVFLGFSSCPLWRVTPISNPEGGTSVRIFDLRFGLPGKGAFSADFVIDASGKVLSQKFRFGDG